MLEESVCNLRHFFVLSSFLSNIEVGLRGGGGGGKLLTFYSVMKGLLLKRQTLQYSIF